MPPTQRPNDDENSELTLSRVLRNVLIWVAILVSLIVVGLMMTGTQHNEWPLTYNEYLNTVKSGNVKFARITKSQLNDFDFHAELEKPITIERDGKAIPNVKAIRTKLGVVDSQTESFWRENGINWTYESADAPWWMSVIQFLPWIILLGASCLFRDVFRLGAMEPRAYSRLEKAEPGCCQKDRQRLISKM